MLKESSSITKYLLQELQQAEFKAFEGSSFNSLRTGRGAISSILDIVNVLKESNELILLGIITISSTKSSIKIEALKFEPIFSSECTSMNPFMA
mmetsp:Transcript_3231/g.2172  ORF Transcript_3231/g.2172 Transcript_3231/m.2172 type:complete len:94 (-) Transcript_3231:500-781(-)